jgi:uncharacterized membrane protein
MAAGRGRARRLATFLTVAGTAHFLVPKFYDQMIPRRLPGTARSWVYGSGLVEIAVGATLAVPRTRGAGALAAAALFVAVLPGNVQMALDAFRTGRPVAEKAVLVVRLPVQLPLIVWALRVRSDAVNGTISA